MVKKTVEPWIKLAHSPSKSADPQCAAVILADNPRVVMTDAVRIGLIETIRIKSVFFPVIIVQSAPGACNPQPALPVFVHVANAVAADAAWIVGVMPVIDESPGFPVVPVQSTGGGYPYYPQVILKDMPDIVVRECIGVDFTGLKRSKSLADWIIKTDPPVGSNPQVLIFIRINKTHVIAEQAVGVFWIVSEPFELLRFHVQAI